MAINLDAETHKKLDAERITNTQIYKFDQITCISQSAINRQLEHMHTLYEVLQKLEIRQQDSPEMGLFNCKLDAPQIKLHTGVNKQQVTYYIRIKKGTLKFYKGWGPKAVLVEVPIADWKIALTVNIALDQMDKLKVPENVKAQIKNLNDFSVYQLLLDFTTAEMATYSQEESVINVEPKDWFITFMNEYIMALRGMPDDPKLHNVIHILPQAKDKNRFPQAPTLAPTDLNFQCLPFVGKEGNGKDGVEEGKANMLVYLQMTGGHTMPQDLLPSSANWVMPPLDEKSAAYDGTICLSKAIFLDEWLLPKLAEFNTQTTWVTTEAWWKQPNILKVANHSLKGHVGITAADQDMDGRLRNINWVYNTNSPPGKRHYTYERTMDDDKKEDGGTWLVYMKGGTRNELMIPEGFSENGKAVIEISGKTSVEAYLHLDGIGDIGKQTCWTWSSWSVKLILDGVDDGHLKIVTTPFEIHSDSHKDNSFLHPAMLDTITDQVLHAMKELDGDSLARDLQGLFNTTWPFIFAGAKDFFIDKACFNREGDLLCQVCYKN